MQCQLREWSNIVGLCHTVVLWANWDLYLDGMQLDGMRVECRSLGYSARHGPRGLLWVTWLYWRNAKGSFELISSCCCLVWLIAKLIALYADCIVLCKLTGHETLETGGDWGAQGGPWEVMGEWWRKCAMLQQQYKIEVATAKAMHSYALHTSKPEVQIFTMIKMVPKKV